MIFQTKLTAMALAAVFLFVGYVGALAPNPVDACNGSNNYGVGHSCAYSSAQGTVEGTCQNDSDGVLVCVPN
ncbi:hypothetical protein EDD18DRAFT_1461154 [Armillaria luteobubalina]|uniref:Uncharacterized protein n=1 Tax=Armillaria luteobubalina TaxID=153913 RepID=A0AA39QAC3_9AGAR|nr:hypothetical protein EDD18DRAFT_1461154 [Armillaria luteobubalina]